MYVAMLPRVHAEQQLRIKTAVGLGTGSFERNAASQMIKALERAANGGRRPKARKATKADLAAMGVTVDGA